MKTAVIFLPAIIVATLFFAPASAISIEDINTDKLDIPDIGAMNFSGTPPGSLESLGAYAERLVAAAKELLDFIESIFGMLGMDENTDVGELMKILEKGMDITGK